jgi:acetyl-CoA carboxylase carboxyl transferase subunit beta
VEEAAAAGAEVSERPVNGEFRVHASVVIADRGKILMVREGKQDASLGKLNLPGGHVEFGETVAEGAAREVLEEAGVGVYLTDVLGVYTGLVREDIRSVRFVFGGHIVKGDPAPGDDILEVAWMTTDEVRARPDEALVAPLILRRILTDTDAGTRWPTAVLRE